METVDTHKRAVAFNALLPGRRHPGRRRPGGRDPGGRDPGAGHSAGGVSGKSLGIWAGLFAAAWILPAATQFLRVDWVLLVVLLLGTGSVLRAGYVLLDRLMLAGILLVGTLVAGGLLFSLWPWGLEPVPVAGTLLTVLVAVGLLTGRRPRLPARLCGSDAIILGAGAFTAWALLAPMGRRSLESQLSITTGVEDNYVHFALFDTIHRLGSYAFLRPAQAARFVRTPTQNVYPEGSHYLYAVLDIFLRSTTNPGPVVAEFNRFFDYTLIGFVFLVVAVTWSARWVAGPAMAGWRRVLICSVVASLAAAGPLSELLGAGFDAETIGLAMLALAIAVAVRPAGSPREQVLMMAAALIAVFYAYNLYGPLAALGILAAAVVYRRRLLRHWLFTAATAMVAVPVAVLPTVVAELSGFSADAQLSVIGGSVVPLSRSTFAGLALVVAASMATRAGRRLPTWRALAATGALVGLAVVGFRLHERAAPGSTSPYYYFDKAMTGAYVICLVGFGAAGLFLRPARGGKSARQPRWRTDLLPGVAVGVLAVTFTSGIPWGIPAVRGGAPPEYSKTWAYAWWSGRAGSDIGPALQALDRARLLGAGQPTLVLYGNSGLGNWRASFFESVLNRDLGIMMPTFNPILAAGAVMGAGASSLARARLEHDVGIVEEAILTGPRPLHVIVSNGGLDAELRLFARLHPDLDLSVEYLPQMR